MNLLNIDREHLDGVLRQIRAGRLVVAGDGDAHTPLVRAVAEALGDDAVFVEVDRDLDAAPYVALTIASQCGADVLGKTARCLSDPAAPADAWQGVLAPALSGRYLLVDGLDRLRVEGPEWDFAGLLGQPFQCLDAWLMARSVLTAQAGIPACTVHPREDKYVSTAALWARVEHDPTRYALAFAREMLLGPAADGERAWDKRSLVRDLWDGMPSEMRELVAYLAVHSRPLPRELFERLSLVPKGAVDRGRDFALIEIRRGQLSVPEPWHEAVEWLDPVRRHRDLADALATIARGEAGVANPLAILEAHRHYAAIPDHEQALSLARFGAGALLETAVRQSLRREPSAAAKTYDALLKLDERVLAAQRVEGLGKRARGYVRHYLHYNRYLAHEEPLAGTIAGYRDALGDWPQNALFWSRLVRAMFVAKDEASAMSALSEAYLAVPRHPERDRVLIVRTVDRLLFRDMVLPAVFVWGDRRSGGGVDRAVEGRLDARLRDGWETTRAWAAGLPAIDLAVPARIQIRDTEGGLVCEADGMERTGHSRADAVRAGVRALVFRELAAWWRRETGGLSVSSARYRHPAMVKILGMGHEVIPEILRAIEVQPDHWHVALSKLAGESPIPAGERVTVTEACARWVSWGRARGLVR